MKTVLDGYATGNYTLGGQGDTLLLTLGANLDTTSGAAIVGSGNVGGRTVSIDGIITSTDIGIEFNATTATKGDTVKIGKSGFIQAADSVQMHGNNSTLINAGVLDGAVQLKGNTSSLNNSGAIIDETALLVTGDNATITNSGSITGTVMSGLVFGGHNATIVNTGVIHARQTAIDLSTGSPSGNVKIVNSGEISGAYSSLFVNNPNKIQVDFTNSGKVAGGIVLDDGNDVIRNSGSMEGVSTYSGKDLFVNTGKLLGSVSLGDGNDTFDGLKGKVTSEAIYGDKDNDTYIINSAKMNLVEDKDEGIDHVKSTASYTLGDNFENLTLLGTKSISGTGNELANKLSGNSAANVLMGLKGDDRLAGGKGNDTLTGGADADTFVFRTGYGKDTVTDFKNGTDHFDLKSWNAITDFADLKAHHLTVSGSDLIISHGTDKLVILDTAKGELDALDFLF